MGVTILAILAAIGGVLGVLAGLLLFGVSSAASFAIPGIAGLAAILGLVVLAVGIGDLIFAYGAWGLKPWAWMLGVGLQVARIVLDIVQFGGVGVSNLVVDIVIAGVILYYLYQPHVRRAFGQNV